MPPNVVMIVTDNQSPWTLGCYGNREILTPRTDQLAREGVRFTNAFCVNPVCSPNRATLLTGLIPSQHGVHNWLGREKPCAQMGPAAYCTIREFESLPRILASAGYDCGMSGKWHLGDSLNPQLGFRYWFSRPRGHTKHFYHEPAIWRGEVYNEPRYATEAITDHALDFLRQPRQTPFFLYVGYNGPYGLDRDLLLGHRNRHTDYYVDKPLNCFPRRPLNPDLREYRENVNNETAIRSYACAVSGVDDGVGAMLDALDEMDLARETIVVFTADHGLCAGHHGLWGMGDHTQPRYMVQDNMRVPLLFRHPGGMPSGHTIDELVCHYDFLPSLRAYLKRKADASSGHERLPGRNYAPALGGSALAWGDEPVYHEYEDTRAVQDRRWKMILRHPDGPDEFYDLAHDPGEARNRIDDPACASERRRYEAMLTAFFDRYAAAEYDRWRDGRSKA